MRYTPSTHGIGNRGWGESTVTWGGSILLVHVFLQQPPQQQPWEVRPKLTPRGQVGHQGLELQLCHTLPRVHNRGMADAEGSSCSVGSRSQYPHSSPQVLQPTVPTKGFFLAPPTQLVSHPQL